MRMSVATKSRTKATNVSLDALLVEEAKEGLAHLYALQHEAIELAERMAAAPASEQDKLHRRRPLHQVEAAPAPLAGDVGESHGRDRKHQP